MYLCNMKDYLRRHIWILSKLYENPKGVTYKEFADEWERTMLNSQQTALPKRTFADCLKAIKETFGIEISSDAYNGYRYRIINGLVTNFHQPQSTLLLLVSALIGEQWKACYRYALDHEFRFLSYGDSCLFLK